MQVRELYTNAFDVTLDNGLRILVEEAPQSRSVSTGVWVRAGSRDDPEGQSGLAHFIEHLAFKGSPTRVVKIFRPQVARECRKVSVTDEDSAHVAALELVAFLRDKELI